MAVVKIHESHLQSLIEGCMAQERSSQKQFYALFYGYAMAVCNRYIRQEDDAIEVMNDGFFKILKDIDRFEARHNNLEGSLKAWMRRIFINTSVDYLRRQKHRFDALPDTDAGWEDHSTGDWQNNRFTHKELLAMIAALSPAYRTVFNLFVIDGYSHEEIARILDISVGTSKSNLAKARANLQKMIINAEGQHKDYERKAI